MIRTREVLPSNRETAIEDYKRDGYAVVRDGDDRTVLRYRDHGGLLAHAVIFVLLGLWTLGLANLVYAAYRRHVSTDHVEVVDG